MVVLAVTVTMVYTPWLGNSLPALRLAVCDLMEEKMVLVVFLPWMTKKMLQLSVMMTIPAHQASVMVLWHSVQSVQDQIQQL